ncbi:hypothetical protein GEMRC1_008950 [Eukaryota sp. GEM-RC1]
MPTSPSKPKAKTVTSPKKSKKPTSPKSKSASSKSKPQRDTKPDDDNTDTSSARPKVKKTVKPKVNVKNTLFFHFNKPTAPPPPVEDNSPPIIITTPPPQPVEIIDIESQSTQSQALKPNPNWVSLAVTHPNRQFPPGTIYANLSLPLPPTSYNNSLSDFILTPDPSVTSLSDSLESKPPTPPDDYTTLFITRKRRRVIIRVGDETRVFKRFGFHDDLNRPPFFGTFSRSSSYVRPRRPLNRDASVDYDYDSAEDWESEEGEDLASGDEQEEVEEEEEEEDPGFVVDDGYLSKDEGSEDESRCVMKVSDGGQTVVIGPYFSSSGEEKPKEFSELSVVTFMSTPISMIKNNVIVYDHLTGPPWPLEVLRSLCRFLEANHGSVQIISKGFKILLEEQNASLEATSVPVRKFSRKSIIEVIKRITEKEGHGKTQKFVVKQDVRDQLGV